MCVSGFLLWLWLVFVVAVVCLLCFLLPCVALLFQLLFLLLCVIFCTLGASRIFHIFFVRVPAVGWGIELSGMQVLFR